MHAITVILQSWEEKKLGDLIHKIFDNLWKSKENNGAVQLLLTSLEKLAKNKRELGDKINQLLTT